MAKQLDLARIVAGDIAYFVETCLGPKPGSYKLWKNQREFLECAARFIALVAGRGSGKSTAAAMLVILNSLRYPGHVTVWTSNKQSQSEHGGQIILDLIESSPMLGDVLETYSAERLVFTNGSRVYLVPSNAQSLRGWHPRIGGTEKFLLILDEAADISEETYVAALGCLTTGESRCIAMGSAGGTGHWFHKAWMEGQTDNDMSAAFQFSTEDIPEADSKVVAFLKKTLDPVRFAAEVQGKFQNKLTHYFTPEEIAAATHEYMIPDTGATWGDRVGVLGLDMSSTTRKGSDFTTAVLVEYREGITHTEITNLQTRSTRMRELPEAEKVAPHYRVLAIRRWQSIGFHDLAYELADLKREFPDTEHAISETYEGIALEGIFDSTRRRGRDRVPRRGRNLSAPYSTVDMQLELISPTSQLQGEAFPVLYHAIASGDLWLPTHGENADVLRDELLNLRMELSGHGTWSWEADKGFNDDTVYALLWAMWALRKHRTNTGQVWAV